MWTEIGGAAAMITIGATAFRFLNGRITRTEDKASETSGKIFDKLDAQNREIGEVKTSMKAVKETMQEGFRRIERKIDDGNRC